MRLASGEQRLPYLDKWERQLPRPPPAVAELPFVVRPSPLVGGRRESGPSPPGSRCR